jgi:hypothetical protein
MKGDSGVREGWGMCCLILADSGRERQKGGWWRGGLWLGWDASELEC